jgi:hypothetical protein
MLNNKLKKLIKKTRDSDYETTITLYKVNWNKLLSLILNKKINYKKKFKYIGLTSKLVIQIIKLWFISK